MGFNISIVIERDGKKATLATVENIDVVEQSSDEHKATFRFHVEGANTETLGNGAKLMVLDKIPAIRKMFAPPVQQVVQTMSSPGQIVVAPVNLPGTPKEPVKDPSPDETNPPTDTSVK